MKKNLIKIASVALLGLAILGVTAMYLPGHNTGQTVAHGDRDNSSRDS